MKKHIKMLFVSFSILLFATSCAQSGSKAQVPPASEKYNMTDDSMPKTPSQPPAGSLTGEWMAGLLDATEALDQYSVYIVGEGHSNTKTYDIEVQLVEYFNEYHDVRSIYLEAGFCNAMLINEYMQTGNKTFLDVIMNSAKGSPAYNKQNRAFYENLYALYQTLPEEKQFVFYGVDIQHQFASGRFYLETFLDKDAPQSIQQAMTDMKSVVSYTDIKEKLEGLSTAMQQDQEAVEAYLEDDYETFCKAIESMKQGAEYYIHWNDEYREQCFTKNFFDAYKQAEGKGLGIWGNWHTRLSGWPTSDWTFNNVAQNIAERIGTAKNGVASICCVYKNSDSLTGQGETIMIDSPAGEALSTRADGDTMFYVLNAEDKNEDVKELAGGQQFAISISDSPAAERYR